MTLINRMHLLVNINYTDGSVHLAIWSTFDVKKLHVYFAGTWLAATENVLKTYRYSERKIRICDRDITTRNLETIIQLIFMF